MAVVQNPLIGRSRGSVSGNVFYTNGGQNVVRSKPVSVKPSNTDRQVAQRAALSTMVLLFSSLSALIRIGFRNKVARLSAYNAFVSKNLTSIFDFTAAPEVTANGSVLKISNGSLTPTVVTWAANNDEFTFTWPTAVAAPDQAASDMIALVMVNSDCSAARVISAGVARSTGTLVVDLVGYSAIFPNPVLLTFSYSALSSYVSDTHVMQDSL